MTAYQGAILGPIAKVLGMIMNAIYSFFEDVLHIPNVNIGIVIIIFTIVIYVLLLPLTYQQQKFTTLSRKISPELNAIRKKYGNRKDQASMMAMQEETRAVYDKYGISTMGSCVQLLIQMPILMALYSVFRNIPAYIISVRNIFTNLVDGIMQQDGYIQRMQNIFDDAKIPNMKLDFLQEGLNDTQLGNYIIDVTYKLSETGWQSLKDAFSGISDLITQTQTNLSEVNYFFILNISDTPLKLITDSFSAIRGNTEVVGSWGVLFAALLIPILSFTTQVLQFRYMNLSNNKSAETDQMAAQMKTMNRIMPVISLFFVFNVPVGLGLYWITGAVIRTLQQIALNKHFEKIDMQAIVDKNKEKAAQKKEKRAERTKKIAENAQMYTRRTMSEKAKIGTEKRDKLDAANEMRIYAKEGSMTSKANLVSQYNKKNNRD